MKENIKYKRNYRISYIRCVSTVLVVILHIIQHFSYEIPTLSVVSDWSNLGLVMFFCISAFLYSNRNIESCDFKRWFVNRYIELAVPSVLVVVVTLIMYTVLKGNLSSVRVLYSLLSGLGLEAFVSDGWMFIQLWFLTYILMCYATVILIQKIDFKQMRDVTFWSIIIGSSILIQGGDILLSQVLSLPTLSWGVLLRFYLSYAIFKKYDIESETCRKLMWFLTICSILLTGGVCYVRYFVTLQGIMAALSELFFIYTQTCAGLVLFYWLYVLFGRVKDRSRLLLVTDRYSYSVYLTHCLFIGYSTSVIGKFDNAILGVLFALLLTVIASIGLVFISEPIKKELKNYALKDKEEESIL